MVIRNLQVRSFLLLLLGLVVSACMENSSGKTPPKAVDGVLDLSNWDFIQDGDGSVVIEISDEGHGVPPQMQEVLFSIGHQTSRLGTAGEKGTGFGLPIVKKLITKMGGSISVVSPYPLATGAMCTGARFSIVLRGQSK